MMAIDFGNLFSTKLFSLESYHGAILCNEDPSIMKVLLILIFHFHLAML